jgi:hypothetical protein
LVVGGLIDGLTGWLVDCLIGLLGCLISCCWVAWLLVHCQLVTWLLGRLVRFDDLADGLTHWLVDLVECFAQLLD